MTEETRTRSISKAEINQLPLIAWEGPVEILEDEATVEVAVENLMTADHLGFDTETRPSFKKGQYYPPALVQLATSERVYLFRICQIKTLAPLIPIFESESILKTGVAIRDDMKELQAMDSFTPGGFIEIAELTSKLGYRNKGLRALAALLMRGRISKAAQVSNWARSELDEKQIRYAATDAWVSREIYVRALAENN